MIKILLALALFFASVPVDADGRMTFPNGELTLGTTACTNPKVVALFPVVLLEKFKSAVIRLDNVNYQACWIASPSSLDSLLIVDEAGGAGLLPKRYVVFDAESHLKENSNGSNYI